MHTQSHNWIYLSVIILEMVWKRWPPFYLIKIDPILGTSMQCTHKAVLDILICYNLRNVMEIWPHFTY